MLHITWVYDNDDEGFEEIDETKPEPEPEPEPEDETIWDMTEN